MQASLDWDAGRYPESLRQLDALLRSETSASERIALLTGENWQTSLVVQNARARRVGRRTSVWLHSKQARALRASLV